MKVWLLACVLYELQTWYLYASLAALNQHLFYSVLPLQEFGALLFWCNFLYVMPCLLPCACLYADVYSIFYLLLINPYVHSRTLLLTRVYFLFCMICVTVFIFAVVLYGTYFV